MKFTSISTFPNDYKFSLSLCALYLLNIVLSLIHAASLVIVLGVIIAIMLMIMLTKGYRYNGKIGVAYLILLAMDLNTIFIILHILTYWLFV